MVPDIAVDRLNSREQPERTNAPSSLDTHPTHMDRRPAIKSVAQDRKHAEDDDAEMREALHTG